MSKESRVETLKAAAEQKKQEAFDQTEKAINKLLKEGKRISFSSIAKEAGVSVSYLYKYPEIKERIQHLRKQQKQGVKKPMAPQPASDKSKMVIISQLRERIRKVEGERDELRRINEKLTGRLYQLQGIEELAERLRAENAELKKQLEECRSHQPATPLTDNPKVTLIDKGKTRGITDRIKDELDRLGIKLNSTLTRKIKTADEETVLNALSTLEEAMGSGNVRNVSGFLVQAITEGWTKEDSPQQLPQHQPKIYTASPEPDEELVPPDQLKKLFGQTDE